MSTFSECAALSAFSDNILLVHLFN